MSDGYINIPGIGAVAADTPVTTLQKRLGRSIAYVVRPGAETHAAFSLAQLVSADRRRAWERKMEQGGHRHAS